jgi:hypothetical protein
VLVLRQVDEADWKFDSDYLRLRKREVLNDLARKALEQFQSSASDPGVMGRVFAKVMDNLQLTLARIHLRVEGPGHAAGLTLKNLSLHTTDGAWQKVFVSREDRSTQHINKLLHLD